MGTQEFLDGEYSLSILVSQASRLLRDVIRIGLEPCGLAMMELFLQVSLLLGIEPVAWPSRLSTSLSFWTTRETTVYFSARYRHFGVGPSVLKTFCATDLRSVKQGKALSQAKFVFTIHEVLLQTSVRHVVHPSSGHENKRRLV